MSYSCFFSNRRSYFRIQFSKNCLKNSTLDQPKNQKCLLYRAPLIQVSTKINTWCLTKWFWRWNIKSFTSFWNSCIDMILMITGFYMNVLICSAEYLMWREKIWQNNHNLKASPVLFIISSLWRSVYPW